MKNGVSLSTLRRHIKANKIEYRVENGRYLLRDGAEAAGNVPSSARPSGAQVDLGLFSDDASEADDFRAIARSAPSVPSSGSLSTGGLGALATDWLNDFAPKPLSNGPSPSERARIEQLEEALRLAHEEIAELKTLVALYEERL